MTAAPSLADRPNLATDRLLLRRPVKGDAGDVVSIVGNWDVARCLARVPHPYGPDDADFFLDTVVPAEWIWAITLRGTDMLIGTIGLTPDDCSGTAELGYWLAPSHWGRGIATEAGRAAIAFAFDQLHLTALTSGYFTDNPASGRVLAKLGSVATGCVAKPCLAAGRDALSVRLALSSPVSG